MKHFIKPLFVGVFCILAGHVQAQVMRSDQGDLRVQRMVQGLDTPWGFGFLPDGSVLITERGGRLWLAQEGRLQRVSGAPVVEADGQGGLLDVMIPRDFASSREVFFTFSKPQTGGSSTAVAVGRLMKNTQTINGLKVIFEAKPAVSSGRHFGSRVIEAADGSLFVTLGERGDRPSAQDLSRAQGSVIRILRDGGIPADNPFVGHEGADPAIWSYGHRNPQGLAQDAEGRVWAVEHGARGGDEVNLIQKGRNYGWPVISYGQHYSGRKIGEGTSRPDMEQPQHYWDPSIAPSGMMIYSGRMWADWRGDIFVGSLKYDYISRLSGASLTEVEQLKSPQTGRVRDLREAPDGSIWFASEYEGALFRISKP